jgi:hypothetical protein
VKRLAILAALVPVVLAGCLGGPTMPAAVAPSLDGWRSLGLTCATATVDNVPSGLLQWSCHGAVRSVDVSATLDGDEKGVFAITATMPAGTDREAIAGAFGDLVDATPALAAARGQIRPWLEDQGDPSSYGESGSMAEFGMSRVKLWADETLLVLDISPGPRRSVSDEIS